MASLAISNDYEYREYEGGDILITHHLRNGEMIGQALYFNETADSQYWLDKAVVEGLFVAQKALEETT